MRARIRAWLVSLIADGIREANHKHEFMIKDIDGQAVIRAIRKDHRKRGGGGVAV